MIFGIKRLLPVLVEIRDALGGISEAVHVAITEREADPGLASRVAALELELERRHAEAEGLLLKAKGKFDAARAAEERTRRIAERAEASDEDLEEAIRAAYEEAGVPLDDARGEPPEGLQPMRNGVADRHEGKRAAFAMKFGQ